MNKIDILKRLYRSYTKNFRYKILLSLFFSLIVAGSTSSIAWLLDPAINKIFIEKDQTLLMVIPALIIIVFASKGLSLYLARTTMLSVAEDIKAIMQQDMSRSLISADTDYIDDKHTGKFISNLTYDVSLITSLVSTTILNLFKDSLTLIGLLSVMFYQNWKLSLIAIIMIPLATFAAKNLGKRIGKVSTEAQLESGFFNTHLIEIFKNHQLIKIFQQEENENSKLTKIINKLRDKTKKIGFIFVRATPIMETLTGIMIAALIYFAGKLVMSDELAVNNFFSFLAAMMLAYQPVRSLATLNMGISQGLSAASRILPIVDVENKIKEKDTVTKLLIEKGNIEFKNVIFKYEKGNTEVLKSVNLKIIGGEMNALVGHSGAGKSTILNLIPRFFDCSEGDILIDNQSIYNSSIFSLRNNISLVSQNTTLFDDTIKFNIKYANPNASDEEVISAAKNAFADEFIEKLPNKYDTIIGEDGVRLSGGEKQRLSIARAILKETPIILLDEATSSLDAETENKIQKGLSYLTKNKTTLVIAHRLSTILNSKKIFVIDNGKVVSEGSHDDLLKNSSVYKNFYEKQIRKE
ncbi:ABC transporter ATP-binding protein/permease [Candidatus Pelagibacter sp.]|nr:ABC transporter ATP-binding protein/permease [Candidatus Pelagibacter bacterium]MDC0427390.1 ABC transporter ATP-binding protein/permease [Candidatus Pelagibacter sp.]MDC0448257.1 ABC transporter ATP-binding protein/permease [Candidatus Pelagibacter sp.]